MVRKKALRIGAFEKVVNHKGGYTLPADLLECAIVGILDANHNMATVEFDGRTFELNVACVDTGLEYLVEARWPDQNDRRWLPGSERRKR